MAQTAEALGIALWLYREPSRLSALLEQPLPAATGQLIRIAGGAPEVLRSASLVSGEPEPVVLEAVRFYLQQVLFQEHADAYRVMGLNPGASQEQVREHHRWLQRWLHPDRGGGDWESVFASRVNQAWSQLRTQQARSAYDALRPAPVREAPWRPPRRLRRVTRPVGGGDENPQARKLAAVALLGCLGLVALVATRDEEPPRWLEASPIEPGTSDAAAEAIVVAPHPLNDALMREALMGDVQLPALETGASRTAALDALATVLPIVEQSRTASLPARLPRAQEARAERQTASHPAAAPSPPPAAPPPSPAHSIRPIVAEPHTRPAVVASTPTPAQPADPLLQMRQARSRVQQIVGYLADPDAPSPAVWEASDDMRLAERLRQTLYDSITASGRPGLELEDEHWTLLGDHASLAAGYRLTGHDGATATGRIAIDFVWRGQECLVQALSLEPAS